MSHKRTFDELDYLIFRCLLVLLSLLASVGLVWHAGKILWTVL